MSNTYRELDARFQAVLKTEFRNTALLVVAHRLQTVLDADNMLVMGKGELREYGPPHELLRRQDSELAALAAEFLSTP